jgi:hypothetical protein
MTEPTHGDYEISEVAGFDALNAWLKEFKDAPSDKDKAAILAELLMNGHEGVSGYLTFGNNKVSTNTGILNMNSATDCPNADSDEDNPTYTGVCQVPWAACYAHKAENIYPDTLKKRRLQEYLWDNISAPIFAMAFRRVKERKRSAFDHIRVSESGDFRQEDDIRKWDEIALRLDGEINVYTYSASHKLDWSENEHMVVNQSNDLANYGDRQFTATYTDEHGETQPITEASEVPDDAILCPFEAAKINGVSTDERPKCGDCTACIDPKESQPRDVAIVQH